jgi:hypothetical protein
VTPSVHRPSPSEVAEAAVTLRRLLAAVDAEEIVADDAKARILRRQLEGAAAAWEEASGTREDERRT